MYSCYNVVTNIYLYREFNFAIKRITQCSKFFFNNKERKYIRIGKYANSINYVQTLQEQYKIDKKNNEKEKHILEFVSNIDELKTTQPRNVKKKNKQNTSKEADDTKVSKLKHYSCSSITHELTGKILGRKKKEKIGKFTNNELSKKCKEKKALISKNDIRQVNTELYCDKLKNTTSTYIDMHQSFNGCSNLYQKGENQTEGVSFDIVSLESNKTNEFSSFELKAIELLDNETIKQKEKEKYIGNKGEEDKFQKDFLNFENKNKIIKKIYKASINHVRDENLWKKYVQNVFIISVYLDSSDIVILFWCFSKIGYRDNRLINLLCTIVLKKINELNTCALALLLNSFKKLEINKYDTIELLTNQFCFQISKCSFQDLALVANSLSFFYVYHKTFWKKCISKLLYNCYFTHPLHLCLTISALARLDIREGNVLLGLSKSAKKLGVKFSANNLALVIHSFAKLKFCHPQFYNYLYKYVHTYLDNQYGDNYKKSKNDSFVPLCKQMIQKRASDSHEVHRKESATKIINKIDKKNNINYNDDQNANQENQIEKKEKNIYFDLQSLVLLLFACVCLIGCTEQMLLKLTYLIIPCKNYLGSHKIDKLKYVSDFLQYIYPSTFQKLPEEIKSFFFYIDRYEIKHEKYVRNARWINEISKLLGTMHVGHVKNVYINNICANIMLEDSDVIIKCLGPYSYYVNSVETTAISDMQVKILEKKNSGKVVTLSYHDWNRLNDHQEKINFLYAFGRNAANYIFDNIQKQGNETDYADSKENKSMWKTEKKLIRENNQGNYSTELKFDEDLENEIEEEADEEMYLPNEEDEIFEYLKNTEIQGKSPDEFSEEKDFNINSIKQLLRQSKK